MALKRKNNLWIAIIAASAMALGSMACTPKSRRMKPKVRQGSPLRTVEKLQGENAELKASNEASAQRIAELEKKYSKLVPIEGLEGAFFTDLGRTLVLDMGEKGKIKLSTIVGSGNGLTLEDKDSGFLAKVVVKSDRVIETTVTNKNNPSQVTVIFTERTLFKQTDLDDTADGQENADLSEVMSTLKDSKLTLVSETSQIILTEKDTSILVVMAITETGETVFAVQLKDNLDGTFSTLSFESVLEKIMAIDASCVLDDEVQLQIAVAGEGDKPGFIFLTANNDVVAAEKKDDTEEVAEEEAVSAPAVEETTVTATTDDSEFLGNVDSE